MKLCVYIHEEDMLKRNRHTPGYRYLMTCEQAGEIKAGRSINPDRRAEERTASAVRGRFSILATAYVPCAACAESRLKASLGKGRKFAREYFSISPRSSDGGP